MAEAPRPAVLAALGWDMSTADVCWLDHDAPGYRLEFGGWEIWLCPEHAVVLEHGRMNGEYSGAPLPAETMAYEWPWRLVEHAEAV